jgi:Mg2+ and Co2+ transporter CorA
MKIILWDGKQPNPTPTASIDELKGQFAHETWIGITDPPVEDLRKIADVLGIPRDLLIGKLRSNYPHVDTYPEYTKVFAWCLTSSQADGEPLFRKSPVVIMSNGTAAITVSDGKSGIQQMIAKKLTDGTLNDISLPARVIYIALLHVLETYERSAEQLEQFAEMLEEAIPPWPRHFYARSFTTRKEAGRLQRLLSHFRALTESLAKGRIYLKLSEAEIRLLDTIYDRATGVEESTEMSLDVIRDLIDMHLDTASHDMNRAMRFMAAITSIVAIPSVIGALLGMNLIDAPWPEQLWQVAIVGLVATFLLAAYFYRKGWLKGE